MPLERQLGVRLVVLAAYGEDDATLLEVLQNALQELVPLAHGRGRPQPDARKAVLADDPAPQGVVEIEDEELPAEPHRPARGMGELPGQPALALGIPRLPGFAPGQKALVHAERRGVDEDDLGRRLPDHLDVGHAQRRAKPALTAEPQVPPAVLGWRSEEALEYLAGALPKESAPEAAHLLGEGPRVTLRRLGVGFESGVAPMRHYRDNGGLRRVEPGAGVQDLLPELAEGAFVGLGSYILREESELVGHAKEAEVGAAQ